MFCLQAGTALSHRVRHGSPNSVNVIRWDAPQGDAARCCRVERWDYDLADERFEPTHVRDLAMGP
jgi:hypothetical protein